MKLLFENWRKHLEEQELIKAQTQALNELSERDYEVIKDWMRNAPEEAYSFGNIFGDKKRIAIPVETGAAKGPIGEIVRLFQNNGWNVDFSNSIVSKEVETTIPKGPRAGEKINQVKKMRIGKALSYAEDLMKKYAKFALDPTAMADDILPSGGTSEAQKKARAIEHKIADEFPSARHSELVLKKRIPELIKFWNEKSEFYRQNPEAAFEKESPFVTILSRHPVDVVRMSDMDGIKSCHSRGGGYFQCAVAESRGHGPIAYLVPRKQFEQYFDVDLSEVDPQDVDLDAGAEEIFADPERGVPGLSPDGRVRLRKFSNGDTTFAAPERRTYGKHGTRTPPNFLKGVTKWALETQKDELGDPNELADAVLDGEFYRYGGSYEDTKDGPVIAAMLESVLDEERVEDLEGFGNVEQEGEDELGIEQELEGGSVEEQAEEIQDRADRELKHIHINHEIMEEGWGHQESHVYFSAYLAIELDDEFGEALDENGEETSWDDRKDEVSDIIESAMDSNSIYPEMGNVELYDDQWRTDWATYDLTPDIDGFDRFVDEVIWGDRNWNEMIEDVRQELSDAGIIGRVPTEYEKALEQFKRYKNIAAKLDNEEKRVVAAPRNPIVLDKNYRNFKEFDIKTQEAIKHSFNSLFTSAAFAILKELGKEILPVSRVFDPLQQGLLVDLDGVKVKFVLDFRDVVEAERRHLRTKSVLTIDEVKRFLNLINAPSNYEKLVKAAQNSYKSAIEAVHQNPIVSQETPSQSDDQSEPQEENMQTPTSESKKTKVSDKMLFESWKRYLGK